MIDWHKILFFWGEKITKFNLFISWSSLCVSLSFLNAIFFLEASLSLEKILLTEWSGLQRFLTMGMNFEDLAFQILILRELLKLNVFLAL